MKKQLKMICFVALYIGMFLLISLLVGVVFRAIRDLGLVERDVLIEFINKYDLAIMAIQSILVVGVYALILRLRKQRLMEYCKVQRIDSKSAFYSFIVALSMGIFSTSMIELDFVSSNIPQLGDMVVFFMGRGSIVIALLSSVFIVPAFEELLFRGLVFTEMRKTMPFALALILQSLLYAVTQANIPAMVFGFAGGIIFALGYAWTNSLWSPMIMQTISCLFMMIFRRSSINETIGNMPEAAKIALIALSIAAITYAMMQIKRQQSVSKAADANTMVM